jgi:hypothetical protein
MTNFNYKFPGKNLRMVLYSQAGVGKTVSTMSLLKIPNLKVRVLALEDNAFSGIEEGLRIHDIKDLEPGRLIISEVRGKGITSKDTFIDQTDDSFYQACVTRLMNFTGNDVVSGEEAKLGNAMSWDKDSVLVIDGLTMLQFGCHSRGKVKAGNNKDPRAAFFQGQDALVGYIYQLLQQAKCNIIVLAHEAVSDEEAISKHPGLTPIHPALGTRSIVSQFLGRFNVVLYAKYNMQTRQYVWSGEEKGVKTITREINVDGKKYNNRPVTLSNLPADFSADCYSFFT